MKPNPISKIYQVYFYNFPIYFLIIIHFIPFPILIENFVILSLFLRKILKKPKILDIVFCKNIGIIFELDKKSLHFHDLSILFLTISHVKFGLPDNDS